MYRLTISQAQLITFVMVDAFWTEVPGLGAGFTLQISKAGGAFAPSTGAKAEISNGWYSYMLSAAETNTLGPLSIRVTGAGCVQQNLEYVVKARTVGCIEFTYTVTNSVTLLPLPNVFVWVTANVVGAPVIWNGITNAIGVARDIDGDLPCLSAATYRFYKSLIGFMDADAPFDVEVVS